MSAGKSKFSQFASPAFMDLTSVPARGEKASDSLVAEVAARWISTSRPQVLFVHLADPDIVGHRSGWGSAEQIAAVADADRALAQIVTALAGARAADSTLIIVSSDHGGAGRSHGGTDVRSRYIPWIAVAPGVRRDYDLTRESKLVVRTEDTFATVCAWLGLPIEKPVDGRAVTEILETRAPGR
jgi:predicted AlkP superfamily pyrophosphatase or phosphodiesterase